MTSGVSLPGLRGKQVFALITLICTIFIVWRLEGAPFLSVLPKDERIRRLIRPDDVRNRFSGSSSYTPPVMESSPSLPTAEPDSISTKEFPRISGLLSNATKGFSVEKSPSRPAKELPSENSPSSSEKNILVGGLFSPEVNNMKSNLDEKEQPSAIEKSSLITAEELLPTKVEKSSAIEKRG